MWLSECSYDFAQQKYQTQHTMVKMKTSSLTKNVKFKGRQSKTHVSSVEAG